MGRHSKVEKLPKELRAEVDRLLMARHSLDEIVAHLRKLGDETVSRSALGRYKQSFDQVAAKLRESREVVDALVSEIGPDATEGKHGRLLVEVLRKLVFDHLTGCLTGDDGEPPNAQEFFFLAKALKEMSQSTRLDQDFESKIREQVRKEAQAEMKAKLDDAESGGGAEAVAARRAREILFGPDV